MRTGSSTSPWSAYVAFLAFGGFWGAWGASVPVLRTQANVTDGQLGVAMLFVGAGAVPAMVLVGRAVDRWGPPVTGALLAMLGLTGVAVAVVARDFRSLCVGLAFVGAVSGGADVAINVLAGAAQRAAGRPVITRAHGAFSVAVVLTSLTTGWMLARGAALVVPFIAVTVVAMAGAARVITSGRVTSTSATPPIDGPEFEPARGGRRLTREMSATMATVGGLGALAFAVENAHQNWSAVYLTDELLAGPALAAAGPAVFAMFVAAARLAVGAFPETRPLRVLRLGAVAAAIGTLGLVFAPTAVAALAALAVAAAGTGVLFPTLLGLVADVTPADLRGRATSVVTTSAYLGFLAGPVYVGFWADSSDLRGAMLAVGALTLVIIIAAGRVLGRPGGAGLSHQLAVLEHRAPCQPG